MGVVWGWCGVGVVVGLGWCSGGVGKCGEVWAGTRVGVVLSQEGVGHALPSSNMLDDLAFGDGVGRYGGCSGLVRSGDGVGLMWGSCGGGVGVGLGWRSDGVGKCWLAPGWA